MSIGYLPRADLSLIVSLWDGVVTADDWRHNLERMLADPAFSSTNVHLVDIRTADIDGTITEQDIKDIVEFLALHSVEITGRKGAILAREEFPKTSIFERLIQPYGLTAAAFTFLDTACAWLGVDPADPGGSTTWGRLTRSLGLQPGHAFVAVSRAEELGRYSS